VTVGAVAPDGRWVALAGPEEGGDATRLVVLTPATGTSQSHLLRGDILPEVFSMDGASLFAVHRYRTYYRVEIVDVALGAQRDALSREKVRGDDMRGTGVAAVMSPDRSLLATLYRDAGHLGSHPGDHPAGDQGHSTAFVHVVDLRNNWTYCADLFPPFGQGPAGDDVIVGDGTDVVVGATAAGAVARIDAAALHDPTPGAAVPVTVTHGGPVPRWPEGVAATPGFDRVVAVLPPGR
jgi:hypothetical protein